LTRGVYGKRVVSHRDERVFLCLAKTLSSTEGGACVRNIRFALLSSTPEGADFVSSRDPGAEDFA